MEEQEAISRLKQGDLNGLQFLVESYQAQAVHAAYLILYERSLAEDIVQAGFIKAAERIHQFDDRRPFAPWFFRIVTNDALKLAKKRQRLVSLEAQLDQPTTQLAQWLSSPEPLPEQVIEQQETRQRVLKAIQSLTPDQRAVIVMRYFLDMKMVEMTAELDRPLSSIKWWLRDAHKRLRALLDG